MITVVIGVAATGAGGALTAAFASRGMRQLGTHGPKNTPFLAAAAVAGGLVGATVVLAAHRSDTWNLLPAFGLWGCVLAAAGLCDAIAQRVPTVLVRPGLVAVAVLFAVGFAAVRDWSGLVISCAASIAAGAAMMVCWHLLEVGFGDVRLATLGGLGLGNADAFGLSIGFLVFAMIVAGQVTTQHLTSSDGPEPIPLGPAIAVGFILAAAL